LDALTRPLKGRSSTVVRAFAAILSSVVEAGVVVPIRDDGSFIAAAETISPQGTQSLTGECGFNGSPTPGLKPGFIGRSDAAFEGPLFHVRASFRGDPFFRGGSRSCGSPFGITARFSQQPKPAHHGGHRVSQGNTALMGVRLRGWSPDPLDALTRPLKGRSSTVVRAFAAMFSFTAAAGAVRARSLSSP